MRIIQLVCNVICSLLRNHHQIAGMEFDALIDLVDTHLPIGMEPDQAVRRVRDAVKALPGARYVSVIWHGNTPPLQRLTLYRQGFAQAMTGGSWDDLRADIERVIADAL